MNESFDDRNGTRPDGPRGMAWLIASPFFRLLAINWLIGAFVAVLVLGGLLWFDTGRLRSLMLASGQPWLPALVLLCGLMITLCSAAMGAAIMALPSGENRSGSGGHRRRLRRLAPVIVAVPARPRA